MKLKIPSRGEYYEIQSYVSAQRNTPSYSNLRVNRDVVVQLGKGPAMVLERLMYWLMPYENGDCRCKKKLKGIPAYYTTYEKLGEELGIPRSTTCRYVKKLADEVLIHRSATMSPFTRQKAVVFRLDMMGIAELLEVEKPSEEDCSDKNVQINSGDGKKSSDKNRGVRTPYVENRSSHRSSQNGTINRLKMGRSTRSTDIPTDIDEHSPNPQPDGRGLPDTNAVPNNPELESMIRMIEAETDTICPAYRKKLEEMVQSGDISPELLQELLRAKKSGAIRKFPERSRYVFRHWYPLLRQCLLARQREIRDLTSNRSTLPEAPPVVRNYRKLVDVASELLRVGIQVGSSVAERVESVSGLLGKVPSAVKPSGTQGYFTLAFCHAAALVGDEEFLEMAGKEWRTHLGSFHVALSEAPELLGDYPELGWSEELVWRSIPFAHFRDTYVDEWKWAVRFRAGKDAKLAEARAAVALLEKHVPKTEVDSEPDFDSEEINDEYL